MRQRDIFWFWLPLFASWLLMSAEGLLISGAINRLPDEVIMLAAMGIVTSLSITIESPIINLLATSTALVRDHDSYLMVRRFTIHWCIALTIVAMIVAFTPLFEVIVPGWLDVPQPIAQWVRPGMQIMIFWSAAIGWRRFLQGILIRYNRTQTIAWGTVIRLLASGSTVIFLGLWGRWPGVIIGALGLMAGVIAEAIYASVIIQPVLRNELAIGNPPFEGPRLTYQNLFWFHLPLAATSLMILLIQPLVTSSLSRLEKPIESLAAWPVIFQILLVARAAAFALPEVVIALYNHPRMFIPLRRFSLWLTGGVTIAMAAFAFTPLAEIYIYRVQDMTEEVGELVLSSIGLLILLPALAVLTSWLRGILIQSRHTRYVNMGMGVNLLITAVVLLWGIVTGRPGLTTAAFALNLAALAEVIYLAWRTQTKLPLELSLFGSRRRRYITPNIP